MCVGALDLDKIMAHRSLSHHTRKGACDCDLGPDFSLRQVGSWRGKKWRGNERGPDSSQWSVPLVGVHPFIQNVFPERLLDARTCAGPGLQG